MRDDVDWMNASSDCRLAKIGRAPARAVRRPFGIGFGSPSGGPPPRYPVAGHTGACAMPKGPAATGDRP